VSILTDVYANSTKYYYLYSDLITTIIVAPPNTHTIDIHDDLVAIQLSFDTDKFTINKFLVSFPEKFPQ
jgi:hypothetical protein